MDGLLLINLGTPDEPTTKAVRKYLREFLSDPMVIDINPVGRFLLLNLFILPFRPAKSAEAYQKVWTDDGSPLLVHGQNLARDVAARLGSGWHVELAMRYGQPSIQSAVQRLRDAGVKRLVVFPLFPHEAASSSGSALKETTRYVSSHWKPEQVSTVLPFYDRPEYIQSMANVGKPKLREQRSDHVLFSFHGLPERHMRKADPSGQHCLESDDCCAQIGSNNSQCYRAQCYATARALAKALELAPETWSVSFQSRLGRTPWIVPHTDKRLDELASDGVKRLAVFCPAFVADCLETLEEIGIRAREQFLAHGGESLELIPCINSDPEWVNAVASWVTQTAGQHAAELAT